MSERKDRALRSRKVLIGRLGPAAAVQPSRIGQDGESAPILWRVACRRCDGGLNPAGGQSLMVCVADGVPQREAEALWAAHEASAEHRQRVAENWEWTPRGFRRNFRTRTWHAADTPSAE